MRTAELKIDLINKITELKDIRIIEDIKKILDFELDKGIFQLNNEQKRRMAEAQQELQNGETSTEEQADKDIEEWLKEK